MIIEEGGCVVFGYDCRDLEPGWYLCCLVVERGVENACEDPSQLISTFLEHLPWYVVWAPLLSGRSPSSGFSGH